MKGKGGWATYDFINLLRGTPNPNHLDISRNQQPPLPLLPIQDQSCVFRRVDQVRQRSESRDELNRGFGFVVAEDADDAVRGAGKEKSLVVFVDEARFVNAAAGRVGVGEAGKAGGFFPVPNTVHHKD